MSSLHASDSFQNATEILSRLVSKKKSAPFSLPIPRDKGTCQWKEWVFVIYIFLYHLVISISDIQGIRVFSSF
jgi:hypothetical protein